MIRTTNNREEYIPKCNIENFEINESYYNKQATIFNHDVRVNENPWLWHLHLKLTDVCNAKCHFCVEQGCKIDENADKFLESTDLMLSEMEREGILNSVSLTGGEPLLFKKFPELIEILKKHKINFLTMNTNGLLLPKKIDLIDGIFDFVDISRHSISDNENNRIFKNQMLTLEELKELKENLKNTKMRIQCVMDKVKTPEDMVKFIEAFKFADDISFRRLMKLPSEYGVSYDTQEKMYDEILKYVNEHFEFREQTIQDYYVYEIWNYLNTDITFSYSNMSMLRKEEHKESENVFREFIVHPDGMVAGSWKKDKKILRRV